MQELDFNDTAIPLIELLETIDGYKEMDEEDVSELIVSTVRILAELRLTQNKKTDIFSALAITQQQINTVIDDILTLERVEPTYPEFH